MIEGLVMAGDQQNDQFLSGSELNLNNLEPQQKSTWPKYSADLFEDLAAQIIGFVPNGLGLIYDDLLKRMPIFGQVFESQTLETSLKFILGITIGQGVAKDIGQYLFRPIGYVIGQVLGSTILAKVLPKVYRGKAGNVIYQLSGQTMFGAMIALLAVLVGFKLSTGLSLNNLSVSIVLLSLAVGASVGLMAKSMLLLAITMVQRANAATMRRNVARAKSLGTKLKQLTKQKAKSRVYREAQDLIQQMNGPKSQETMEAFFKEQYESMVYNMNIKIDRHFNYLIDKACCGDMEAQKRLVNLIPKRQASKFSDQTPLEVMLDRIFNDRTLFQLKDDIDNSYDRFRYQALKAG